MATWNYRKHSAAFGIPHGFKHDRGVDKLVLHEYSLLIVESVSIV